MKPENFKLYKKTAQKLVKWQRDKRNISFDSKLFDLIEAANDDDKLLIQKSFPLEFRIWEEWDQEEHEADFFNKYEVKFGK